MAVDTKTIWSGKGNTDWEEVQQNLKFTGVWKHFRFRFRFRLLHNSTPPTPPKIKEKAEKLIKHIQRETLKNGN